MLVQTLVGDDPMQFMECYTLWNAFIGCRYQRYKKRLETKARVGLQGGT
jgi:hypothetical protein